MAGEVRGLWVGGARIPAVLTAAGLAATLAVVLGACGTISDQTTAAALVSPGKYNFYSCSDIDARVLELRKRQTELEQLMARASQSAGGEIINALSYRTEYLQTRGDLAELSKTSADKQCAVDSQFSSGRAVF